MHNLQFSFCCKISKKTAFLQITNVKDTKNKQKNISLLIFDACPTFPDSPIRSSPYIGGNVV